MEKFCNISDGAVKLCVPVCESRPRKNNKPKWWNNKFEAGSLYIKKNAQNKYLLSQNENDKREYEKLRRKAKRIIR